MISPRRIATTLFATAMVFLVLPASVSAAVTNTYVDDSGSDLLPSSATNPCTDPALPCKTIQQAITNNVGMGGTIHVGGATTPYQENLILDGGKRLIGDTTFVSGDVGKAIIDAQLSCTTPAVTVSDLASEIRGLAFQTTGCSGQVGIDVQKPGTVIERSLVKGFDTGVQVDAFSMLGSDPPVDLESDVIIGAAVVGIAVNTAELSATNVTIVNAAQDVSLTNAHLTLDSSLLTGSNGISPAGTSTCAISYSPNPVTQTDCSAFTPIAAPGFDPADPDGYHLASNSPLIDAGNPAPLVDPNAKDIDGNNRSLDGTPDCHLNVARRDIGADEFVQASAEPLCPIPQDITSARRDKDQMFLGLAGPTGGNYTLCVQGPMRQECRGFNARSAGGGTFRDTVTWGEAFGTQGPGSYTATWFAPGTTRPIGPPRSFSWGVCPPRNQLMDGVWKPNRLIVVTPCKTITVTIADPNYYSSNDHDIHLGLSGTHPERIEVMERDRGHMARSKGRNRGTGPSDPHQGQRVRATGVYVCDTFHGPFGSFELHPPFRLQILRGRRVVSDRISGPQYPGTPRVRLKQQGRFHCV